MRDLMAAAARLLPGSPVQSDTGWWTQMLRRARSLAAPFAAKGRAADPVPLRRLGRFLCALARPAPRLLLRVFPRRGDVPGAGAGSQARPHLPQADAASPASVSWTSARAGAGCCMWAAEHYGVDATGITLSKNQHAHVQRGSSTREGLQGRVRDASCATTATSDEGAAYDKIASVGMFEHVGAGEHAGTTSPRSTRCSSRAAWS